MAENTDFDTEIEALNEYPNRWPARRRLVERMVDAGKGTRAAEVVWAAPSIPQEPAEIAWALSILSKYMARRAVRLTHALVEKYAQKPRLLARLADNLERVGCGLQAARVYGAAQLADPAITDAEFESGLMALDAAGTAAAGIAGKGEVVGVLNWVPGGGKGLDAEDPAPEIQAGDPAAEPASEASTPEPASAPAAAPAAKPTAPPAIAPKAGAPPKPVAPSIAPPAAKAPTPAPSPAAPAAAPAPTPGAPKPVAAAPAAKAPAPAAAPKPVAAKAPIALKKPISSGAPKPLGAPVGPPKISKAPGQEE